MDTQELIQEVKAMLEQTKDMLDRHGLGGVGASLSVQDAFEEQHLITLARLNRACGYSSSTTAENEDELLEQDLQQIHKKRKLGTKAPLVLGGPKDPWKRITNPTNFERLPDVPKYVLIHIRRHGNDAQKFLRALALISDCGDYTSNDDLGNAFMSRYQWTNQVNRREEQIRVLQLFNDLFWFDIMQCLRPKGTGRVGDVMLAELDTFLTPLHFETIGLRKDTVIENISEWSLRGAKINKLCRIYGPGIILVLHKQFSRHFFDSRFTASGVYFDGAITRLDSLGLKDTIKSNKLGDLAQSVRELMIKPFRDALRGKQTARGGTE